MIKKYCRGDELHINVRELDSKVWHDNDQYQITCLVCGAKDTQLARRPNETLLRCQNE